MNCKYARSHSLLSFLQLPNKACQLISLASTCSLVLSIPAAKRGLAAVLQLKSELGCAHEKLNASCTLISLSYMSAHRMALSASLSLTLYLSPSPTLWNNLTLFLALFISVIVGKFGLPSINLFKTIIKSNDRCYLRKF